MERRIEPRIRKRISCDLQVGDRRFSGLVLDLSETGLFIQTVARPLPGARVRLGLTGGRLGEPLQLEARVARTRLVPPQLRTVARGGLGIHLERPPDAYLEFLEELRNPPKPEPVKLRDDSGASGPAAKASRAQRDSLASKRQTLDRLGKFFAKPPPRPAPSVAERVSDPERPYVKLPRFRIRLVSLEGNGNRSFVVCCENEQDARDRARRELGESWKITSVERI